MSPTSRDPAVGAPAAGDPSAGEGAPDAFARIAQRWRPDPVAVEETLGPWPARALAALLGAEDPGADDPGAEDPGADDPGADDPAALPPLWHEVYLRDAPRIADLGPDGHPRADALLPSLPDRRRMFGGGRITVVSPLRIGERVRRVSGIESVRARQGRSGWLLLVTERHVFTVAGETRVVDERDIVYRAAADVPGPGGREEHRPGGQGEPRAAGQEERTAGGAAPPSGRTALRLEPDERLLMLTSALTYNPHRIHYDRDYATGVEGHPDLVVHGPLLALHGIEAARGLLGRYPARVSYRLTAPAYLGAPVDFQPAHDSHPAGGADASLRTEPDTVRVEAVQCRDPDAGATICMRLDADADAHADAHADTAAGGNADGAGGGSRATPGPR